MEVEATKRAGSYIGQIVKIIEESWPRVCLREEVRRILNGHPSRWGREFKKALAEVGDSRVLNAVWENAGGFGEYKDT